MRFTQEGEWKVSSPVYLGDDASVISAMLCDHQFGSELTSNKMEGELILVERCKSCIAVRTRTRALKPGE